MPGVNTVVDYEAGKHKAQAILDKADIIFCLDFNVLYRTKHLEQPILASKAIKVLIDHHQEPAVSQFDFGISDTNKSSTCEMVYDFIMQSGHQDKINNDVATCLYTGVMTDTGSFRFPSTKASVHRMVAHFKDLGLEHNVIHNHIYDNFLENRLRFTGHALLNRLEVLYEYNTALMYITKQDLLKFHIKTGDSEGLVSYLLTIQGVKLGAICIDRDEERKWSFRSKGNFDVNTFARKHFEGGGHFNAAGGRSGDSLEQTVKKFKEVITAYEEDLQ
jgi:phosphoesterase RecJ-like protein